MKNCLRIPFLKRTGLDMVITYMYSRVHQVVKRIKVNFKLGSVRKGYVNLKEDEYASVILNFTYIIKVHQTYIFWYSWIEWAVLKLIMQKYVNILEYTYRQLYLNRVSCSEAYNAEICKYTGVYLQAIIPEQSELFWSL